MKWTTFSFNLELDASEKTIQILLLFGKSSQFFSFEFRRLSLFFRIYFLSGVESSIHTRYWDHFAAWHFFIFFFCVVIGTMATISFFSISLHSFVSSVSCLLINRKYFFTFAWFLHWWYYLDHCILKTLKNLPCMKYRAQLPLSHFSIRILLAKSKSALLKYSSSSFHSILRI